MELILLSREEFQKIYDEGPDACYQLFQQILLQNEQLKKQVELLTKRVQVLEDQLAKNSQNSHKPPSSDKKTLKKTKSLRQKSKKKVGAQKGHKGETLSFKETPDFIETHTPLNCAHCNSSLENRPVLGLEKRQVFDLPPLKINVTEHQSEIKSCGGCGKNSQASFPQEVRSKTQYGEHLKALCVYLHSYQFLPYKRISQLFEELFFHSVSPGTLVNMEKELFRKLDFFEDTLKQRLIDSEIVNFDESGIRWGGKRKWFHVSSTPNFTYYFAHEKRGEEGMEAAGVLPYFKGRAIHDFWKSYFRFNCKHGLCNVHHLRELSFLEERYGQIWAREMKKLLVDIKKKVEKVSIRAPSLSKYLKEKFEKDYDELVSLGLEENPELEKKEVGKRGRQAKSKGRNLAERFLNFKDEILGFMYDFKVPFSNNQGERDVRMVKVQQKISGCFRSKSGAKRFCRIRSYLSTTKKHHLNTLQSIKDAFLSKPFIPAF